MNRVWTLSIFIKKNAQCSDLIFGLYETDWFRACVKLRCIWMKLNKQLSIHSNCSYSNLSLWMCQMKLFKICTEFRIIPSVQAFTFIVNTFIHEPWTLLFMFTTNLFSLPCTMHIEQKRPLFNSLKLFLCSTASNFLFEFNRMSI